MVLDSATARERMALSVNEIVAALIEAHKQGKDVNLNRLKCDVSWQSGMRDTKWGLEINLYGEAELN